MRIDFGYWSFGGKTMVKCHIIQCSLLHWHRMYHVFIYCYKNNKNKKMVSSLSCGLYPFSSYCNVTKQLKWVHFAYLPLKYFFILNV